MNESKQKKPRPAWWPRKMAAHEWSELENSYGGICLACGELRWEGCEPDARNYPCEECDARRVYGAEEARMMGAIEVEDDED